MQQLRNKVIRIFISSTFEDMRKERDILQQKVYPYLVELCAPRGWQIDFVDLRWGISKEAGVQQKTMRICLQELERCQKVSPRPNFLILQGQRYGWCPLPEQIEEKRWRLLMELAEKRGVDKLLAKWYRRDANNTPVCYELRGKNEFPEEHYDTDFTRYERDVEAPLHALMVEYVANNGNLTEEEKVMFAASATEQEIMHGALSKFVEPQQVAAYIRTVTGIDEAKSFEPLLDNPDQRQHAKTAIAGLINKIEKRLADEKKSICEYSVSYKHYHSEEYLTSAEEKLKELLKYLVEHEMDEYERVRKEPWEVEVIRQEEFVKLRTRFFRGRSKIVEEMVQFPSLSSKERLFCLEGPSGTGKSSVMGKVYLELSEKKDYVVLIRSVGEGLSTSGQAILTSLIQELYYSYFDKYKIEGLKWDEWDKMSYGELVEIINHVMYTYHGRKIVLMIDAIDQLPKNDPMRSFDWLPLDAEGDVCAIVSRIVDGQSNSLPTHWTRTLDNMEEEGRQNAQDILQANLEANNRRLTQSQTRTVLDAFEAGGYRPIYLKLMAGIASEWRESDDVVIGEKYTVTPTVDGRRITIPVKETDLVDGFFELMAGDDRHGWMVERALAFMFLTRRGISDGEIRKILALDEEFMDNFRKHSFHDFKPVVDAFPSIIWTRFYYDVRFMLAERIVNGGAVNNFNHRQVFEGVQQFLDRKNFKRDRAFLLLTAYFGERYRMKDVRALEELPRVLKKSGRYEEQARLLLDIDFMQYKSEKGMVFDYISDLEVAFETLNNVVGRFTADDTEALLNPEEHTGHYLQLLERTVLARYVTRLHAVYDFVVRELANYVDFAKENPFFSLQLLYNAYNNGPLKTLADEYMERNASRLPEMYLRTNRQNYDENTPLVQKLAGHSWCITSLAVNKEGTTVVTASDDKLCKVWDMQKYKVLRTFYGHQAQVSALSVEDDFKTAWSGSWDGQVLRWDVGSAFEKKPAFKPRRKSRRKQKVTALLADNMGGCWAAYENRYIYHIVNGKAISHKILHSRIDILVVVDGRTMAGCVNGDVVEISDNGISVVASVPAAVRSIQKINGTMWVSTSNGCLFDLSVSHLQPICTFPKYKTKTPADYRFSATPDGSLLAAMIDTDIIVVSHPGDTEHQLMRTLKGHTKDINALKLMPEGTHLISGGRDRRLMLWNTDKLFSGDTVMEGGSSECCCRWFDNVVMLSRQTSRMEVVAASLNGSIVKWGSKENRGILVASGLPSIYSIDIAPDGHTALCSAGNCRLMVLDIDKQHPEPVYLDGGHTTFVNAARFSPDGRWAVSNAIDEGGAGKGNILTLWDMQTLKSMSAFTEKEITGHDPYPQKDINPNDKGINQITGRYVNCLLSDQYPIYNIIYINCSHGVTWSPCGKLVAVACRDNSVAILDPFKRVVVQRLIGHENEVKAVVFSPDGRYLYSGSWDNNVIVWDLHASEEYRLVARLRGHNRGIYALDVAPDGKTLVSGANDRTFIIWNLSEVLKCADAGKKDLGYRDNVLLNRVICPANCNSVAFTRDGVIAGLDAGEVMVTENSSGETLRDIPFVTASPAIDIPGNHEYQITCPCCGSHFAPPQYHIEEIVTTEPYPSLMVHDDYDDRHNLSCPKCHNTLRLNHFLIRPPKLE